MSRVARALVPRLDTVVATESPLWAAIDGIEGRVQAAAAAAFAGAGCDLPVDAEVSIALVDDATIRDLNRTWRGKDSATNVLSFPAPPQPAGGGGVLLGDIAIAYETTAAEAVAEGKAVADHVAHLVVHGVLHLLGHDHIDDDQAALMEATERAILACLGIADPYAEREAD